jgi:hypothetical protein
MPGRRVWRTRDTSVVLAQIFADEDSDEGVLGGGDDADSEYDDSRTDESENEAPSVSVSQSEAPSSTTGVSVHVSQCDAPSSKPVLPVHVSQSDDVQATKSHSAHVSHSVAPSSSESDDVHASQADDVQVSRHQTPSSFKSSAVRQDDDMQPPHASQMNVDPVQVRASTSDDHHVQTRSSSKSRAVRQVRVSKSKAPTVSKSRAVHQVSDSSSDDDDDDMQPPHSHASQMNVDPVQVRASTSDDHHVQTRSSSKSCAVRQVRVSKSKAPTVSKSCAVHQVSDSSSDDDDDDMQPPHSHASQMNVDPVQVCQSASDQETDVYWSQPESPVRRMVEPVQRRRRVRRQRPVPPPAWRWELCNNFRPANIRFTGDLKINANLPENPTELDYFRLYLTDDITDLIVTETNRYADQYLQDNIDNLKPHSSARSWKPTDSEEIITFLGLLLLMGIVYKPRLPMYWSTDEIYHTNIFSQVIPRDRFLLLLRFLHFANNDENNPDDPERDRLHKIRHFSNLIRERCKAVVEPGQHICVDESLVLYKGRLTFKQYIRTKRARFGVKFYTCCTSGGITLDFMIYHGGMNEDIEGLDEFSTTERIALSLVRDYMNQGRCVYLDNYYTTPRIAHYLLENQTTLVGTVRSNRNNFPRELASAQIEKGQSIFYKCEEKKVLAVKFRSSKDKTGNKPKIVHLLSTCHKAEVKNTKKKDRDGNPIVKPTCVLTYNTNMGGVDLVDQQLDSLNVLRKTYKWYKKIALRLLLICLLNSHKMYQLRNGKHDFLQFLHNVIAQMLTHSPKLNKPTIREDVVYRLTARNHFPTKRPLPESSQKKKSKWMSKVCRVCYARGYRSASGRPICTNWVCEGCPSMPGLHIDMPDFDCFKAYHTKIDYSK